MEHIQEIIDTLKKYDAFKGDILTEQLLSQKTTFKVGGKAGLFIAPINYYSFQIVLTVVKSYKVPFFILGGGSNVVFPDNLYDGVIISTQNFNDIAIMQKEDLPQEFNNFTIDENQIIVTCFCGTPMASLVNFCTKNNIHGMEQFAGLPGTVGGAVYMNARCFEHSISDTLLAVSYMEFPDQTVELKRYKFDSKDWAYKVSPFQDPNKFITTATFLLTQQTEQEHELIESECKKFISERVTKGHFKFPSAGSVFKNNHDFGKPSGMIIDEAGLRGFQIGGAKVADFHGNFIINTGNATSSDIKSVVEYVQKKVFEKYSFSLETEIIFVENKTE